MTFSWGEVLTIYLALNIAMFAVADLIVWLLGHETMSRWVMKECKDSLMFTVAIIFIVVTLPLWLLMHWEIWAIIKSHVDREPEV